MVSVLMCDNKTSDNSATPQVALLEAKETDIDPSLTILNKSLGEGFVTLSDLNAYTKEENKIFLIAREDDTVVAVITAEVFLSPEEFLLSSPTGMTKPLKRITNLLPYEMVGVIKSVAVVESAQKRGIASSLIAKVKIRLQELGATQLLSIGWTDETGCHIQTALESAGFNAVGDISDFWLQDSIVLKYSCPTCSSPCRCVARIFLQTCSQL